MVSVNLLLLGLIGMASGSGVPTGKSSGYDPNDDSWTYEGPEYWPIIFPNCNGVQQSPIDIGIHMYSYVFVCEYKNTYRAYKYILTYDCIKQHLNT